MTDKFYSRLWRRGRGLFNKWSSEENSLEELLKAAAEKAIEKACRAPWDREQADYTRLADELRDCAERVPNSTPEELDRIFGQIADWREYLAARDGESL